MTTTTGEDWDTHYARMCVEKRRAGGAWLAANPNVLDYGSVSIDNGEVIITVYASGKYAPPGTVVGDLLSELGAQPQDVDAPDRRHWSAMAGDVEVLIVEWLR